MGKANNRPTRGRQARENDAIEDDSLEKGDGVFQFLKGIDMVAVALGGMILVLAVLFLIVCYVTMGLEIDRHFDISKAPLSKFRLDAAYDDLNVKNRNVKERGLESHEIVNEIERAIQYGNLAYARQRLMEIVTNQMLSAPDVIALSTLVSEAEAQNPIANISQCNVDESVGFIKEKGGKVVVHDKADGIMIADFDFDQSQADGRGRGVAVLQEMKADDVIVEVPASSFLSIWSVKDSPELAKVFSEEKITDGFTGLMILLLHEASKETSAWRKYLCSLPLYTPLPFMWSDADIPADFMNMPEVVEERKMLLEYMSLSYNTTVAPLMLKYPQVFPEDRFTKPKWAWALSIVISRAIAMKRTGGVLGHSWSLADPQLLDAANILEVLKSGKSDAHVAPVLVPVVDMMNHDSNSSLACKMKQRTDGTIIVTAADEGLQRGFEVAINYSPKLCGNKPLNRWGFMLPPCEGDAEKAAAQEESAQAQ